MMLYSPGDKPGLCQALQNMQTHLAAEETRLRNLTDRVLKKLEQMTDDEFDRLDLYPDF